MNNNQNFIGGGTTFFDMVLDKAKIVGLVVSGGTLFSALLIKVNNILFTGVKGATIIPYSVSFLIFLGLLLIGSTILAKYSMDAYPFYKENIEEENNELVTPLIPQAETVETVSAVPETSSVVGEAETTFVVNNINNGGLFTPLGTINNVISSNNGIVINPVVTELEQQMIYNNSYQEPIVENTVFSEDSCCDGDVLWSDVDGDGTNDFIM